MAVVRSGPEFAQTASATFWNVSRGEPQTSSTNSGVYRAKCRRRTCQTHFGSRRVGVRLRRRRYLLLHHLGERRPFGTGFEGGSPPLSSDVMRAGLTIPVGVPLS